MSWQDISTPTEMDLLVGFYDLTGYMRLGERRDNIWILELMAGYFDLTGGILEDAGGAFLKTMGDAGFAVFHDDDVERGVEAFLRVKAEGDAWLRARELTNAALVKLHFGPVACGFVGPPSIKRFDVYGRTVNAAALLKSGGFAMSPQVFRKLGPGLRKQFKKHTPPVTYIAREERHTA